jgi:uncharacterized membrane protein YphA (DoxX/SURF4 family)
MSLFSESRIPHSLRITIFFLRLALGLNFFYLGWSTLFGKPLAATLRAHSMSGLYGWLGAPTPIASVPATVFAWIFLGIGVLLAIGLFTRLAAIVGAVLVIASWLPGVSFAAWNPAQFVNDDIVIFFALLILILAHAGTYLGLDKFVKWSKRHKE